MDDLISRQAAIDALSHMMDTDGFRDGWAVSRANVDCMLRSLPSAQPEIARCKDCKHRDKYGCCKYWKGLAMSDVPIATDDNDFCSYAI